MNPLTAPNGTKYEKKNENDMLDAIAAGDVYLAPMPAPEGNKPGCGADIPAFVIPVGAKNVEGAHDFINWILTPEQNPAYVLGPGAGFPVLQVRPGHRAVPDPVLQAGGRGRGRQQLQVAYPTITDATGARKRS